MRVVATLELTAEIGEFVDGWNERDQHFAWTKAADELLAKVRRKETSRSGHQSRSPSRQAVTGRRGGHVWPVVLSGLGAITLVVLAAGIAPAGLAFHSRRCVSVPRA